MPKMKTHRGAAKRFKITGTGKLKRRRAFRKHLLEGKASTRTRRLKPMVVVADRDESRIKRQLGI
jgi:large subunit ribosomal protein L35